MSKLTTADIVDRLGGKATVAAAVGCKAKNVHHWIVKGVVPPKHHHALVSLAARLGRSEISHGLLASLARGNDAAAPDSAPQTAPSPKVLARKRRGSNPKPTEPAT
jgi:hypothetical protein